MGSDPCKIGVLANPLLVLCFVEIYVVFAHD